MPAAISRETKCAVCSADLEPGHFRQFHPEYASFRKRWWPIVGLYFVVSLAVPLGIVPVLRLAETPFLDSVFLVYIFGGMCAILGSRLLVEKHYRSIWKQEHPIAEQKIRIQISLEGEEIAGRSPTIGTISGRLMGKHRKIYLIVRPDAPFTWRVRETGQEWTLNDLVITNYYWGLAPLDELLQSKTVSVRFPPRVRILKPMVPLSSHTRMAASMTVSFATGKIMRLQ